MYRLSSNLTMVLKLFIPFFWTTILLGFTVAVWTQPRHFFGGIPLESVRWASIAILLMSTATFLLAFWPLKRVETDGENVYVSNYFRTAHYSWRRDVEGVSESRFLFFRICTLELNGVGSFGRKMRFLPSKKLFNDFRAEYPQVMKAG